MITIDDIAKPGSTVLYDGRPTTVLTGHYEDAELGWMIKTSLFPGGMPANKYTLPTKVPEPVETATPIPAISFELALIDEPEPVKITAELIRQKTKPLTGLSIASIFDEKGYAEVKKAVTKAVKVRTGIEKLEKEHLGKLKATYDTKKKEVTDYTSELYTACREAQTALEAKLTVIDNAKKEAADKLAADEKARTEGRDNALFNIGMTFNGQAFVGYGKAITKNSVYSFSKEAFDALIEELEVLQLEQGVSGEVKEAIKFVVPTISNGAYGNSSPTSKDGTVVMSKRFENQIYTCSAGDYTFCLTKGEVSIIEGQVVINERIMESAIFAQVIFNK